MEVTLYASATAGLPPHQVDPVRAKQKREALKIKNWRQAHGRIEQTPEAHDAWEQGAAWRRDQNEG